MRRCIDCLISSAKQPIASWYAALRFWADTHRHARTDIISVYGTIPVSTGYALSALTYRFKKWLAKQMTRILQCDHFHVIFTIPEQLRFLWHFNKRLMTQLLFTCSRDALF